jgi:serine/threonine protein kinase
VTNGKPPRGKLESDGVVLAGRFVVDRVIVHRPLVIAYRAWDIQAARPVILEMLDESLVHDPELMPRLRKEAGRSTALVHSNILTFQGLYEGGDRVITVRDYVDGTTLAGFMTQAGGPLPLYEVIQVIEQVAQGLQQAHRAGMLHRAVNPRNIWLRYDGRVLVAGLGLPSLADIGTESEVDPAFLSPEQCSGQKTDHRTDLYSLAAVSFWMCTGQPLFAGCVSGTPGDTEWERICWEQVNAPAPFASKLNPDLPRDIAWVISRGLAKRPEERFRSVAEYVAVMKRAMQEGGLDPDAMLAEPPRWKRDPQPVAPPQMHKGAAKTPKRHEAIYWLVGLVLVVAAIWGLLITLMLNRSPLAESRSGPTARPAAAFEPASGGGPLPTWTPPIIIGQPTATRLPVLLAPPQPTQAPAIPGDLPYNALKPATNLFDWDAYTSKVSWRAYTDPHFGYALTYPNGWTVEQSDNVLRLYMPERDAAVVVCSCGTRVADSGQWAVRFLDLLRRDFGDVRQLDQQPYNDRWLATLAQIPQGGDDIQITALSSGQGQSGFDIAFIAWSTDWQGIKPIFDRMAREMRFP